MRWSCLSVVVLLLGACSEPDGAEPRRAGPPPTEVPDQACRDAAERVADAFTRPEGARLFRGVDRAPVASRGAELDARLPRLVLTRDAWRIDGVAVRGDGAPSALASELRIRAGLASREGHAGHGGGWVDAVLLYAPGDAPIARLREGLSEMDPALRFDLVVQVSSGSPEEPRPPDWLEAELLSLRAEPRVDARRERFRALFTRSVGGCVQARSHAPFLFGRDPSVPETAAPTETLSESMLACACDAIDVDALVAIGILTGPPNRHPLRGISFRRVVEPSERAITAVGSDSVSILAAALASRTDPVRVYFAPSQAP